MIGPAGGLFVFEGDIRLEVPPGAIDQAVTIEVHVLASNPGPGGLELARPVIELLPSGTQFVLPLELSVGRPRTLDGQLHALDALMAVTYERAGDEAEELVLELDSSDRLVATLWHFSQVAIGPRLPPMGSVSAITLAQSMLAARSAGKCDTAPLAGLDTQIRTELLALRPGALVEVPRNGGIKSTGPIFLQPSVASDLALVLADADVPSRAVLQVNSSWRSIADQYLLSRCGNANTTADVTTSNHLNGTSLDIQPQRDGILKEECQAAADFGDDPFGLVHATWGAALEEQGSFRWFGGTHFSGCPDQPHFDHVDHPPLTPSVELRALGVLAFMNLWDRYNPCDPVLPAERALAAGSTSAIAASLLPDTLAKLARSPAAGFTGELPTAGECDDPGITVVRRFVVGPGGTEYASFVAPGTLVVSLDGALPSASEVVVIAERDTTVDVWVPVPTSVIDGVASATVPRLGTYALIFLDPGVFALAWAEADADVSDAYCSDTYWCEVDGNLYASQAECVAGSGQAPDLGSCLAAALTSRPVELPHLQCYLHFHRAATECVNAITGTTCTGTAPSCEDGPTGSPLDVDVCDLFCENGWFCDVPSMDPLVWGCEW